MKSHRLLSALLVTSMLGACSPSGISESIYGQHAHIADMSQTQTLLKQLPPPKRRPVVSVYDYKDLTGQHKPSDNIAEFSRAVTQGGAHILIKALMEAGNGRWFQVIERTGLDNLLQERKIIRATRKNYTGEDGKMLADIPPLLYAGLLIEGGIIAYESNTVTGGFGARYLGIGGSTEYRRDMVTVYLRATSVSNGEILLSTNASKTIFSTAAQGGVFKYVGIDEILEVESGMSVNEPPQYAARQAIEMAVYSMIMEGAEKGLWEFDNKQAGDAVLAQYRKFKGRNVDIEDVLEENALAREKSEKANAAPAQPALLMTPPNEPYRPVGVNNNRRMKRTLPAANPVPPLLAPNAVVPVPTNPNARINIPHQNIPQPSLEQLPSSAKPTAKKTVPPILEDNNYRARRDASGGRYRNELYCNSEGCYPVPPRSN